MEHASRTRSPGAYVKKAADAIYKDLVRKKIAIDKRRPDGRGTEEIRPISTEVDLAADARLRALHARPDADPHALHARHREGAAADRRPVHRDGAPLHPPLQLPAVLGGGRASCAARSAATSATGARAAGLEAVIPPLEDFPYTIRLVSETLENGSSSMGSVCGSTMSLMHAGVPIAAPVSGIAMGLVKEGDELRRPDRHPGRRGSPGDMDFKVAGTAEGITALQMDIKITGVTQEIMRSALEQAKRARVSILEKMAETISEPRTELAGHAADLDDPDQPRLHRDGDRQGRRDDPLLEADYDVQIDIEEDGTILVYATEGTNGDAAISAIAAMTKEPEVGDTYTGASSRRPTSVRSSS